MLIIICLHFDRLFKKKMSFTSQNPHYDSSSKRMSVPATRVLLPNAIIGGVRSLKVPAGGNKGAAAGLA